MLGKFIVIDGSDGSGKGTQTKILIEKLKSEGHEVASYDFPQYDKTFFGRMVGRYLNGEFGQADEVSPYLASVLYAGDRYQASEKIKKDLSNRKIVVANRYIQSNMGHQTSKITDPKKKQEFLDWLEEMEYGVFNIPKADLVIYLQVPYKIAQSLVDQKEVRSYTDRKRDIHEADDDYLRRSDEQYRELARIYPEWRIIDCAVDDQIQTREEIAGKVWAEVKKII
jgi:dTMP kinase